MKQSACILLFILMMQIGLAQSKNEYPELRKFRKWSLVAGPVLYNKAKISPQYGDYTFDNKPMWGFNAGFEYDFFPLHSSSFERSGNEDARTNLRF